MEKRLNTRLVSSKMLEKGFSQQDLADKIGVSKAAISKWLKPSSFPKPSYLLKLGKLLNIRHGELVINNNDLVQQVAFRKSGNYKIKDEHIEQFQFVARLLKRLTPYLPFDQFSDPSILSNPEVSYGYIQSVVKSTRGDIAEENGEIKYTSLIKLFNNLKAILIPVLWDKKSRKHGTHIHLEDSKTTWIFLNIDSSIFDFKFWMAHELGHAKAPQLVGDQGEDFADRFAGALLFPEEMAKDVYENLIKVDNVWDKVNSVVSLAKEIMISPLTIYYQLKYYCEEYDLASLDLEHDKSIFKATADLNKQYQNLSENIFSSNNPSVEDYLNFSDQEFGSVFFHALKGLLTKEGDVSPKFISNVLDIPLADAYEIMRELIKDERPSDSSSAE